MAFKAKILFIRLFCDLWKWSRPSSPNTWQAANRTNTWSSNDLSCGV